MVLQDIPQHEWPAQLMAVLTGKACSALAEAEPGAVMDQTVREQYLNSLPGNARTWLLNRNPANALEMAQHIGEYKL